MCDFYITDEVDGTSSLHINAMHNLKTGHRVFIATRDKRDVYEVLVSSENCILVRKVQPNITQPVFIIMDEAALALRKPADPKRRALLAQLERAKLRRDKNAIRDLTRQLEKTA